MKTIVSFSPRLLYAVQFVVHDNQTQEVPARGKRREAQGRSGVHSGQRFFRVIIVHEGLLDVEVRGQVVLVELHM